MRYLPVDLKGVKTYSIKDRFSKESVDNFSKPVPLSSDLFFKDFLESLPKVLAVNDLQKISDKLVEIYNNKDKKICIAMLGGHVIKCGLSPVIIDAIQNGLISAIAMNGAASIHDFEIAMFGKTSEDVDSALEDGSFGMGEETAKEMNGCMSIGLKYGEGMGESLGRYISTNPAKKFSNPEKSIMGACYKYNIPCTIHSSIGCDIIHQHPSAFGSILGEMSHRDFRLFIDVVSYLKGGLIINMGSAVVLPEVFLKALSVARNLKGEINEITSVVMDMHHHYRPMTNVIKRPTKNKGEGHYIIGHHEIMIPLLFAHAKQNIANCIIYEQI